MPEAKVELSHRSPWELLVATILSAQCTDQRVNQVTPVLFKRYKTPSELAKATTAGARTDHPLDRLLQDQSQEPRGLRPRDHHTIRRTCP